MGHPRIMQKQWSLDEVRQLRELAKATAPAHRHCKEAWQVIQRSCI